MCCKAITDILRLNKFKALSGKFAAPTATMMKIRRDIRQLDGSEQYELLLKLTDCEDADDLLAKAET
ncbi:MAG: hypothetical protein WDN06_22800 [Asticcacaulis sp.]